MLGRHRQEPGIPADLAQYAALLIEDCEGKPIADPAATVLAGQPDACLMVIARAGPADWTGINVGMRPKTLRRVVVLHRCQQSGHVRRLPWAQQQSRRMTLGGHSQCHGHGMDTAAMPLAAQVIFKDSTHHPERSRASVSPPPRLLRRRTSEGIEVRVGQHPRRAVGVGEQGSEQMTKRPPAGSPGEGAAEAGR
jgi:hypothetical protein